MKKIFGHLYSLFFHIYSSFFVGDIILIKSKERIAVVANCIKGEMPMLNIVGIADLYAHLLIDNALISINMAINTPKTIIIK